MKHFFAITFLLNPFFAAGQIVDPAASQRVDSLIAVSRQLTGEQQLDEAMQVGAAAQKTALETFGKESAEYARCQFNRGRILQISGSYDSSGVYYREAKAIREKVLGKENEEYVWSLNNLANLYRDIGRYEDAEPLYREAIAIQEKVLGKDQPMYARLLNNLALLYHQMGRYEDAEQLHREAKDIREKKFGTEHRDYANSLINLGDLYTDMGRYYEAERLYLGAKAIREKLDKDNIEYAQGLNNLALLYHRMGRYKDAEDLFLSANAQWEKLQGKEHPNYAIALNNLASLYFSTGRYKDAEQLYGEATVVWEKKFGKEHPYYATGLNNLAEVYAAMQRYEAAEPLYLEAKTIRAKVLGKMHPEYAATLNHLANLYGDMHRYKDAEPLYREANGITNSLLSKSSRYFSDRELSAYAQLFIKDLDHYYSFAETNREALPDFSGSCYDNALFHKGFLLNVASRINNLAVSDSTANRLNKLLKSYHRRLAKEYAKPIAERVGVDELEALANTTEKELISTVTGFSEAIRQLSWQEVQVALKPGEAAIEFIYYRFYTPDPADSEKMEYAALVLKPGVAAPQFVPLFEESQLARLMPKSNDMDRIDEFYKTPTGKSVYELIWQPLENQLDGISKVYCSPTGLLHSINLGAIPIPSSIGGQGAAFSDRHRLVLLGSTRQLVKQNAGMLPTTMQAVLFGGIQYDSCSTYEGSNLQASSRSPEIEPETDLSFGGPKTLQFLYATLSEVKDIAKTLRENGFSTQLWTGAAATEEVFKQLGHNSEHSMPRILHIATHGYFFQDPKSGLRSEQLRSEAAESVFKISDHAMIRSGLVLAGANETWVTGHPPANREDGILTAYEISQQNLSATELVVLSACETGLGQIEGNEGVFGLQRAFKIAGTKYLIMSLWQVNDLKTSELMIEFYRQYLELNLPVPEAFWQAQQTMRAKYPGSPYVWAAFVLIE